MRINRRCKWRGYHSTVLIMISFFFGSIQIYHWLESMVDRTQIKSFYDQAEQMMQVLEMERLKGHNIQWFHPGDFKKLNKLPKKLRLTKLSEIFQSHLTKIQGSSTSTSCSNLQVAISCGINHDCGFGCNLHHTIACMILSYSFNVPFIHKEKSRWPYHDQWSKYFKHIGTNCSPSSFQQIFEWNWGLFSYASVRRLWAQFPTKDGIPMPKLFAEILQETHENPFLWFLGQVCKTVFQLNEETVEIFQGYLKSLRVSMLGKIPLIGMHVRRTDKYSETNVVLNATHFMKAAIDFKNNSNINSTTPITIFLASEDCRVLKEFQNNYPSSEWNFVSCCNGTYENYMVRKSQLFEIIRDVYILSECDYVICTYSSNICRLVLMIQSYRNGNLDPESRVRSLDGLFSLILWQVDALSPIFYHV